MRFLMASHFMSLQSPLYVVPLPFFFVSGSYHCAGYWSGLPLGVSLGENSRSIVSESFAAITCQWVWPVPSLVNTLIAIHSGALMVSGIPSVHFAPSWVRVGTGFSYDPSLSLSVGFVSEHMNTVET